MIPDEKLFEIIKYAGGKCFNVQIIGDFEIVEISQSDDEIIQYKKYGQHVHIIKGFGKQNNQTKDIEWLEAELEYYNEMLVIANMLQDSIEGNEK
jgi:hypothetical protein